jgi:acylphosphatase
MRKRVKILINGRVQGVGFRHFVKKHAQELSITGYIKNREDGTVEVVGEGEEKNISDLIEKCKQGSLLSRVNSVAIEKEKAKKEYIGFRIEK